MVTFMLKFNFTFLLTSSSKLFFKFIFIFIFTLHVLSTRSVNADPNYGSAWFHCREQPYDIPATVLQSAQHKLVHELSATQNLYARAMMHFIRRSLASGDGLNKSASISSVEEERTSPFQLTAMGGRHSPLRDHSHRHSNTINNSSSTTMVTTTSSTSIHSTDNNIVESPEVSRMREGELLSDINLLNARMLSNAAAPVPSESASRQWTSLDTVHIVPFVSLQGSLFCSTDFISGIIEMNRSMYNNNLPDEVRRKNLFGSDQIIS